MSSDDERPQLVLDEELFLQAIKTLAEIEERTELLHAVRNFSRSDYVAARFTFEVEREIERDDIEAIDYYVGAVYLVHDYRANLGGIGELEDTFGAPTLAFIRTAAWAFLSAWNLRYGGLYAHHLVVRTVVDPSVDDPPSATRQ